MVSLILNLLIISLKTLGLDACLGQYVYKLLLSPDEWEFNNTTFKFFFDEVIIISSFQLLLYFSNLIYEEEIWANNAPEQGYLVRLRLWSSLRWIGKLSPSLVKDSSTSTGGSCELQGGN